MRKLLTVVMVLVLFISCSKSSDSSATPQPTDNIPADGWRLGTETFTYTSCVRYAGSGLKAYGTPGNSLFIAMNGYPTSSSTYSIMTNSSATLAANQLSVLISTSTGSYKSVSAGKTANVDVTNGVITVTIPEIDLQLNGGTTTYKFATKVHEK